MKPMLVATVLAALAVVGPACAQSADGAAAPAAAPSARQLELARQLVDVSGSKAALAGAAKSMIGQVSASLAGNHALGDQGTPDTIDKAEVAAIDKMTPLLLGVEANAYAETYSEQELADLVAFYRTPTGQALVAKTPQLTVRLLANMTMLGPQMRLAFIDAYCTEIACTPVMRRALISGAPSS